MKEEEEKKTDENVALPFDRFHQLGWIIRRHFFDLIVCSAYTFLFALPLILWVFFISNAPFLQTNSLFNVVLSYGVMALLAPILALGLAGSTCYFKRLSWNEGADVKGDFLKGIKENGKRFALLGFLAGIIYFLLHLYIAFLSESSALNAYVSMILIGVGYAFLLLAICVFTLAGMVNTTYNGKFGANLWAALKLSFANLYKGIWIYLAAYLPFILFEFIGNLYFLLGVLFVGLIFYFGFGCCICTLYADSLFDRAFNRRLYPEAYRRGLMGQGDVTFDPKKH